MPIYEYRCEPCNDRFEAFLATSSDAVVCPKCQGTELTRLMSMFASAVAGGGKGGPTAIAPAGGGALPGHKHSGGCGCH